MSSEIYLRLVGFLNKKFSAVMLMCVGQAVSILGAEVQRRLLGIESDFQPSL